MKKPSWRLPCRSRWAGCQVRTHWPFTTWDREERRAMAVASNAPFSEWKQTFTDPRLCSAIVDRVTFNAHIIETGEESYRLQKTQEARRNTK
ncbi:ATP-binding protein [Streptacidiphilus sp. MAP5-3]|uniref:ATP-binding protein n=1 Tax=unclassified Streptacidiphilus TaxID=2643834 RepID=UPI003512F848